MKAGLGSCSTGSNKRTGRLSQSSVCAFVHKHHICISPKKNGKFWNNCMKLSELYQLPKSHPVVRGSTRWGTHSCAQLAVSKLLWDLYCRNALVGNSSPSFIFFVCIRFPLCPHPFSHPVPRFVHPSVDAFCQCWLHPGGCNHIWTGSKCHRGAFSPPICISPICWQGPWGLCFRLHRQAKEPKTKAALHFSRPLLAPPGWGRGGSTWR